MAHPKECNSALEDSWIAEVLSSQRFRLVPNLDSFH
jgi:hypothetical protein